MHGTKSVTDLKVVIFLKADLGICYMPDTVLGMTWPVGTLQLCKILP